MEKLESNYNMIDWWKKVVFKNYANFNGRARRAEFWYFVLLNFILIIPLYALLLFGTTSQNDMLTIMGGIGYLVIFLGTLVPAIAVLVRRLHDTNKSGWHYFVSLIPFVGGIILLIYLFTDGNRFDNNYGPDPKNETPLEFDFDKPQSPAL